MAGKTIVVLATLDTKGREAQYLREQIERLGDKALMIDSGVVGTPAAQADIPREAVAEAGGTPLARLLAQPAREVAAPVMANGATKIVTDLAAAGKIHGIVALGGTQGTTLSTKVMRALPYGFPKVMVSTMASGNVGSWVDIKDLTMMFSVTEAAGYETIVFHAIGPGGRAMEQLMREGVIGAVLDYSTIEVSNEMYHALLAGGPDRLTVAGKLGLPQVICPGAIEVLVFNEPETVPAKYQDRTLIAHSPQITDVRLNKEEMAEVGREVARRLRHTQTEAVFMIPTAGYDSYAVEGQGFYDPTADAAFVAELKAGLPSNIRVIERNTHIEDPAFATEAVELLISLIEAKRRIK
jgi:uncharacterized protein (UPF0261 family)